MIPLFTLPDNESPKIHSCPADVILLAISSSSRVQHSWIPPIITDNAGQVDVIFGCSVTTCYQVGTGSFAVGVTTVVYKAKDHSGNENICNFTVTVTGSWKLSLVCFAKSDD